MLLRAGFPTAPAIIPNRAFCAGASALKSMYPQNNMTEGPWHKKTWFMQVLYN